MAENPILHNGGSNLHIMKNNEYANLFNIQSACSWLALYKLLDMNRGYYS